MRLIPFRERLKRWQWWLGLPLLLMLGLPCPVLWLASLPFRALGFVGEILSIWVHDLNYRIGRKSKWLIHWMAGK